MIAHGKKIKIFTGNSHPELAKEIADLLENGVKYSAMIKNVRFNQYNPDEHITAVVKLLFD